MSRKWRASPDRLVAKTCLGCGALLLAEKFGVSNGKVRSTCRLCMNARTVRTPESSARAAARRRQNQAATRRQAANEGKRWRSHEVEVLLDPSLSTIERAHKLRRSYASVLAARSLAKRGELPIWEMPHNASSYRFHGCRCPVCVEAFRAYSSNRQQGWRRQKQERTVAAARRGEQWTGPELELLVTRDDLTLEQVAELLGRTFAACRRMRNLTRNDPKYMRLAGVEE